MSESKQSLIRERNLGDVAIDGLFAGVAAGLVMLVLLEVAGLLQGEHLGGVVGRFDPGGMQSPLSGLLAHLAVSGVYGLLYGFLRYLGRQVQLFQSMPAWFLGGAYGLLLFLISQFILPLGQSAVLDMPVVLLIIAHILFGVVLGVVAGRQRA